MGGCATKPKVLKDNDPSGGDVAPAPEPATTPRAPPPEVVEDTVVKDGFVGNKGDDDDDQPKEKEQPEAAVVDDSLSKNTSLGTLFKENQEVKDSEETVNNKVPHDVSEVTTTKTTTTTTTKEVEKTIPEDSSMKKEEETKMAAEEDDHAKESASAEKVVVGEIADKKPATKDDVVNPEEANVETKLETKPENPQKRHEQFDNKELTDDDQSPRLTSLQPPPPPPPHAPPSASADEENFGTPKGKPEETSAKDDNKKMEKKIDEQIKGEEVKQ